jgi:hypothetical protein
MFVYNSIINPLKPMDGMSEEKKKRERERESERIV